MLITSLNMRGMGDKQKRGEILSWLRAKRFCIYLLQEVHCSGENTAIWSAEWGYKALFSCGSSTRGGAAILFILIDIDKDKKGWWSLQNALKSAKLLSSANLDGIDLVGARRAVNPDTRSYIWRRHKPEIR